MRPDFNKQLTERERFHHTDHYHNYRHIKGPSGAWGDDEVGGREGMRVRYNHGYDRKSFNENLNPLYGWLRSCVGKNWDKKYSELRKQFDARKVINAHILEHLFQDVEVNTHIGENGAVMFMGNRYQHKGEQPIKHCYKDFYVCPKSGMLRKTHKEPRRSVIKQQEADALKEKLAVRRDLDDRNVLHLIDGVWFHFQLKDIPEAKVVYDKPVGVDKFRTGYQFLGTPNSRREKTWDELNQTERERFGHRRVVGGKVRDVFADVVVYRDQHGTVWRGMNTERKGTSTGLYHATKATASHKQLKQVGLA